MKLKALMLGLSAAALVGTSAKADTLYIAGSTAFRVAATHAIIDALIEKGGGAGSVTVSAAYVGSGSASESNLFGATEALFVSSAGDEVKTHWTGSSSGVIDMTEGSLSGSTNKLTFIADGTTTSLLPVGHAGTVVANGTTWTSAQSGNVVTSSALTDSHIVEAAFSDSFYTSVAADLATQGGSTALNIANDIDNNDVPAGASTIAQTDRIGIVPFAWWASKTDSHPPTTTPTNITQQAAYALTQGPIPVTWVNGDTSETGDFYYLIGRNEDSGTRIAELAESTGTNLSPNPLAYLDTCKQFAPTFSNGTASTDVDSLETGGAGNTVTGLTLVPANTPLAYETTTPITWGQAGHSGFAAGGDVKNVMLATNPDTGLVFGTASNATYNTAYTPPTENNRYSYFLAALGWSDGYGITGAPATSGGALPSVGPLKYNGVAPSAANIANGTYSFYSYEHLYYINQDTLADDIADLVVSTYACTDGTGNYASTVYPTTGTVLANTDQLLIYDLKGTAGVIYTTHSSTGILATRSYEGGAYGINY